GCLTQQNFSSNSDCAQTCRDQDFSQGECIWPLQANKDMTNIGICTLPDSTNCDQPGECQCYCHSQNFLGEQSEAILNNQ
ncbi:hypothetical protein KJ855_04715, partial [Patescibacteria group bacterium]|nr:hypothetical protein [Patescibacteria group bacterium]